MTDQLDRLETAFADRYRIEREGGAVGRRPSSRSIDCGTRST
jgi:hypothetical protein